MPRAHEAVWRSRITRSVDVAPDQLLANPNNWRIHSAEQQRVMGHMLGDVGWVSRVIVQEGSDRVIDGHMRVALAISKGEASVPVDYVDLSDEEANKVLATFDPLGAMAGQDEELVRDLWAEIAEQDEQFLSQIGELGEVEERRASGIPRRAIESREDPGWDVGLATPEEVGQSVGSYAPSRFLVIVELDDEEAQKELVEELVSLGHRARAMVS